METSSSQVSDLSESSNLTTLATRYTEVPISFSLPGKMESGNEEMPRLRVPKWHVSDEQHSLALPKIKNFLLTDYECGNEKYEQQLKQIDLYLKGAYYARKDGDLAFAGAGVQRQLDDVAALVQARRNFRNPRPITDGTEEMAVDNIYGIEPEDGDEDKSMTALENSIERAFLELESSSIVYRHEILDPKNVPSDEKHAFPWTQGYGQYSERLRLMAKRKREEYEPDDSQGRNNPALPKNIRGPYDVDASHDYDSYWVAMGRSLRKLVKMLSKAYASTPRSLLRAMLIDIKAGHTTAHNSDTVAEEAHRDVGIDTDDSGPGEIQLVGVEDIEWLRLLSEPGRPLSLVCNQKFQHQDALGDDNLAIIFDNRLQEIFENQRLLDTEPLPTPDGLGESLDQELHAQAPTPIPIERLQFLINGGVNETPDGQPNKSYKFNIEEVHLYAKKLSRLGRCMYTPPPEYTDPKMEMAGLIQPVECRPQCSVRMLDPIVHTHVYPEDRILWRHRSEEDVDLFEALHMSRWAESMLRKFEEADSRGEGDDDDPYKEDLLAHLQDAYPLLRYEMKWRRGSPAERQNYLLGMYRGERHCVAGEYDRGSVDGQTGAPSWDDLASWSRLARWRQEKHWSGTPERTCQFLRSLAYRLGYTIGHCDRMKERLEIGKQLGEAPDRARFLARFNGWEQAVDREPSLPSPQTVVDKAGAHANYSNSADNDPFVRIGKGLIDDCVQNRNVLYPATLAVFHDSESGTPPQQVSSEPPNLFCWATREQRRYQATYTRRQYFSMKRWPPEYQSTLTRNKIETRADQKLRYKPRDPKQRFGVLSQRANTQSPDPVPEAQNHPGHPKIPQKRTLPTGQEEEEDMAPLTRARKSKIRSEAGLRTPPSTDPSAISPSARADISETSREPSRPILKAQPLRIGQALVQSVHEIPRQQLAPISKTPLVQRTGQTPRQNNGYKKLPRVPYLRVAPEMAARPPKKTPRNEIFIRGPATLPYGESEKMQMLISSQLQEQLRPGSTSKSWLASFLARITPKYFSKSTPVPRLPYLPPSRIPRSTRPATTPRTGRPIVPATYRIPPLSHRFKISKHGVDPRSSRPRLLTPYTQWRAGYGGLFPGVGLGRIPEEEEGEEKEEGVPTQRRFRRPEMPPGSGGCSFEVVRAERRDYNYERDLGFARRMPRRIGVTEEEQQEEIEVEVNGKGKEKGKKRKGKGKEKEEVVIGLRVTRALVESLSRQHPELVMGRGAEKELDEEIMRGLETGGSDSDEALWGEVVYDEFSSREGRGHKEEEPYLGPDCGDVVAGALYRWGWTRQLHLQLGVWDTNPVHQSFVYPLPTYVTEGKLRGGKPDIRTVWVEYDGVAAVMSGRRNKKGLVRSLEDEEARVPADMFWDWYALE